MDPTISAAGANAGTIFLRHIPTFALKWVWRYTPAGFNFIILMLELDRFNATLAMRILSPNDEF